MPKAQIGIATISSGGRGCPREGRLGLPGSSGDCHLFLSFLGRIAVQKCLGKCLEVPGIQISPRGFIVTSASIRERKILVSVKFLSAILGPEMGASIFMDAWKNALFLQEKPMSIKFLVLGGGYFGFFLGGGVPILFLCARGFL